MLTKKCSCCGTEKSLEDFQVRNASKDGRTSSCKDCLRQRDALRYRREAQQRLHRHQEYVKTPVGKEAHAKSARRWVELNRSRRAAQVAVGNAVRDGRLQPQPCHVCGETAEAHHPDYDRPLDVVWLCPQHHKQAHTLGKQLSKGNP